MNINTKSISRRQLVKSSGALVVSFNLYGPLSRALAQSQETPEPRPYAVERVDLGTFIPGPEDYLDPKELDSWLAVMQDGTITMFTGKVDIGTGTRTHWRKSWPRNSTCLSIVSRWLWEIQQRRLTRVVPSEATPSPEEGRSCGRQARQLELNY